MLLFASIYFYVEGIFGLSTYIVNQLPLSVDIEVANEVRKEILLQTPVDEEKTVLLEKFYDELGFDNKTKVYVLKAKDFNAFALPDNSIFLFDQVLKELQSYTELAAVLGHEYSHIKNRHGMKTLAHALLRESLSEVLTVGDNSDNFISNANQLLVLEYSREFEIEADKGGIDLLYKNRIDLNGMLEVLKRIEKIEQKNGEQTPPYLSTHPDAADRLELIEEEIKKLRNNHVYNEKLDSIFKELKVFKTKFWWE